MRIGDSSLSFRSLLGRTRAYPAAKLACFFLALAVLLYSKESLAAIIGGGSGATQIGDENFDAGWVGFGGMMCKFQGQSSSLPNFLSWLSYLTGVFFAARFLMLLRLHWENPQQTPIHRPLLHGVAAGGLMALPGFCRMLVTSVYGTPVGGATACAPGAPVVLPTPTLDLLAQNLVNNIRDPIFTLGGWVCYFMGVLFIYRGLDKLARYGTDPRAFSTNMIVSNLGFGAILLWLGQTKDVIMNTIWDSGTTPEVAAGCKLAYAGGGGPCTTAGSGLIDWVTLGVTGPTVEFDRAFIAATTFMQIVGFIGFIRGWFICKKAVEGNGNATIGQGMTHIIGGALCMNLILFLRAFSDTVGFNFLT